MSDNIMEYELDTTLNGGELSLAIVVSRTNASVTDRLLEGCIGRLRSVVPEARIRILHVPGTYELVAASRWAFENGAAGVVAIGAVIRGSTPHFQFICDGVTQGLAKLSAEGHYAAFGVLTTDNVSQAMERSGGTMGNKGEEAAEALVQMLSLKKRLASAE